MLVKGLQGFKGLCANKNHLAVLPCLRKEYAKPCGFQCSLEPKRQAPITTVLQLHITCSSSKVTLRRVVSLARKKCLVNVFWSGRSPPNFSRGQHVTEQSAKCKNQASPPGSHQGGRKPNPSASRMQGDDCSSGVWGFGKWMQKWHSLMLMSTKHLTREAASETAKKPS